MSATPDVPFVDLAIQWRAIEAEARPEFEELFQSSAFTLGPYVERFETAVAEYLGVPHAIGVNSGTSALHLALIAAGIGPGDRVLLPAMTFVATAWPVLYVGAEPVLCDVEPRTGNIDIESAERQIGSGAKAIIPVHLYGQTADMAAVNLFADRHGLAVIEDAAQAIGARAGNDKAGCVGQLGCFSFYPAKNLGAAGEGGLIVTSDDDVAVRLRALRHHAQSQRYIHDEVGFNYRMEGIQGLVLYHKLKYLDASTDERRLIARTYLAEFSGLPLELPVISSDDHVYHLFVVRTPDRDRLRDHLTAKGVQTGLHYPVPLHRQPCFRSLEFDLDAYPVADRYANECLSLPIFNGMANVQIDRVVSEVRSFFGRSR